MGIYRGFCRYMCRHFYRAFFHIGLQTKQQQKILQRINKSINIMRHFVHLKTPEICCFSKNQNYLCTLFFLQKFIRAKHFIPTAICLDNLTFDMSLWGHKNPQRMSHNHSRLTSLTKRSSVSWRACAPSSRGSSALPSVAAVKVFAD